MQHPIHWLLAALLALPLLLAAAAGWLAWKLADGPLDAPWLARAIERQVNRENGDPRLALRAARLSWQGFRGAAPLEVGLSGLTLRDARGRVVGSLPDVRLALAFRPLLRGTIAATEVTLTRPEIFLRRAPDGAIALDLPPGATRATAPATPDATPAMLADLMRPAEDRASHTALRRIRVTGGLVAVRDEALGRDWRLEGIAIEILRAAEGGLSGDGEATLRAGGATVPVHLSGEAQPDPQRLLARLNLPVLRPAEIARLFPEAAALEAIDAPLAIEATAELDAEATPRGLALHLAAPEGGRIAGLPFHALDARLTARPDRLDLEAARIALADREVTASGRLLRRDDGWRGEVALEAGALDAADLPRHWPESAFPATRRAAIALWPQGRLEKLVLALAIAADAPLREWRVEGASASGQAAAATLDLGEQRGQLRARALELDVAATRDSATLRRLSLQLEPPPGSTVAPTALATGAARLERGEWRGELELALDRLRAADLPTFWPPAVGGGERDWITQNVTAGEVSEGRWRLTARAPADLSTLVPLALEGEARLADATIHWLRPIPPIRGVSGRARFSLDEITLATRGGRQERENGEAGSLEAREGTLRFRFPDGGTPTADMTFALAGPVSEAVAIIRHPRLRIFERRPFPVQVAAGTQEGTITLSLPLIADLRTEQVRLRADTRIRNGRLTRALLDRDIENLDVELGVDMDGLRAQGTGAFAGSPVRLGVEMDFRAGPANQVVSRETASGRWDARTLAELGLDLGGLLSGPVALEARSERRRNNQNTVALRGDLIQSTLAFPPLNWTKPRGSPGSAEALLRLNGDQLTAIENIRVEALELALRMRAVAARGGRIERLEFSESLFGGSRFVGDLRFPAPRTDGRGAPWQVALRGPVLDLRPVFGPAGHVTGGGQRPGAPAPEPPEGDAPPLALDLRFDQVLLAPGRDVFAIQARAGTDRQGVVREATLRGRTARAASPFELVLAPRGEGRALRGTAEDGGALLRALGIVSTIQGGRMTLAGSYAETRPGAPLQGQVELDQFAVRDAPALGKLLQAMTLYGLVDAVQGGSGLAFSRAVIPFTLTPEAVQIADARAFSPSLGLTARGRVLRERAVLDMEGTIVPAYFFNSLLGNLPLVGRLFSPEAGGGVFAATFRAQGEADDAQITVNPLAALTPGFLRGLFGLAEGRAPR